MPNSIFIGSPLCRQGCRKGWGWGGRLRFHLGPFPESSFQAPGLLYSSAPNTRVAVLIQRLASSGCWGHAPHHSYSVAEFCSGQRSLSLTGEQLRASRCVQVLLSPGRRAFLCPLPRGSLGILETGSLGQGDPFLASQGSNRRSLLPVTFLEAGVGRLPCEKLSPLKFWCLRSVPGNDPNLPLIWGRGDLRWELDVSSLV